LARWVALTGTAKTFDRKLPQFSGITDASPAIKVGQPPAARQLLGNEMTRAILIFAVALAGCATTGTSLPPIHSSLVMWPKGSAAACDFDNPQREESYAVSYGITTRAALGRLRESPTEMYSVDHAQLLVRPAMGEVVCLTVSRGTVLRPPEAVLGFEVKSSEAGDLVITPVTARIMHPATPGAARGDVEVALGFASGLHRPEGTEMISASRISLGAVPIGHPVTMPSAPIARLEWHRTGSELNNLVIGVVVTESRQEHRPHISDERLARTLEPHRD